MKILQISSAKNFGGGEKHLIDLAKGLHRKKHDVYVALREENNWQKHLSFLPDANIIRLPLINSIDVFSAVKLAKIIRERQVEIIHAHVARDYPVAAMAARFQPPAKLVFTRHLLLPLKSFHKLYASRVNRVIAVSGAVRDALAEQHIFSEKKIKLVLNGTDIENLAKDTRRADKRNLQNSLRVSTEALIVGAIGELKHIKGQDLFLRAAAQMAEKFPHAHFLIAGADNSPQKSYEKYLRSLRADLNLNDRAHFVGFVENVGALMRGLDVFVSAARTEPFGLVLIEAMACRTPVVATATEGAREILSGTETGKLVSPENPAHLAQAVGELLSDEKTRETFAANGQAEAKEKFSLERMVDETEKIYRETLNADDYY